jgi:hypothetical protein
MKKAVLLVCVLLALAAIPAADDGPKILEFETMVGVDAPFTRGNGNAIRGVDGGGVPWVLDEAKGELRTDGRLEVEVEGLIIPGRGNPSATFAAVVSCLSRDAMGNAVTVNLSSGPFPADPDGNSKIEAMVALPSPCIAPIVFVTNGAGTAWFAATGF